MKRSFFTYFTTVLFLSSCINPNVLTYKSRIHYSEHNIISSDTSFKVIQRVCYSKPKVIDDGFCYNLTLNFFDTSAAKTKKVLSLPLDSNIVHAEYGIPSVWNWANENNQVVGEIEVIHWENNKLILRENLVVTDLRRKETKKFLGKRVFTPKKGW